MYPLLDWCTQHGIPVYVFRLASLNGSLQKELNAIPEDRRHQRMCVFSPFLPCPTPPPHADSTHSNSVALWEFMSRFTLPFCSALPRSPPPPLSAEGSPTPLSQPPITATTSIIDLGGVSLGLMWSLRRHLQQASELATAHYPETLHTIAVVNAPSFFPVVWGWIKVRHPLLFIHCKKMHPLSRLSFAGLVLGLVR